ncbi:PLD nuclease N-terminal domain-containing protein [Mailhella massiliensis]|uniref:PLD nuclease N-terminal domain-containing protein n=1 Tax=Mailhella massiliensis TaxID=1903261 RepID=A0A921AYJ5_9BACT|nr:PLD nuclease N-terminal domain-containing protein [Mailhella massiliensis]HJD98251.1 PLD nuclease N-terminal domain-containing protein [Mailhella massiliensis]
MLITDLSSEQLLMLIVPALPNMWALKHAMYHDFPTTKEKYRWMMACVFIPCLGGIAYYFVGRKHASREKVDIRARIEAERARAAGEKAKAEAPGPVPLEASPAREEAQPAAPAEKAARTAGGDWSFGCPDEERKS